MQEANSGSKLPRLEIVTAYDCRGFKLFEDKEKVSSEVNKEDVKFLSEFLECKEVRRRKKTLLNFDSMLKVYGLIWLGF